MSFLKLNNEEILDEFPSVKLSYENIIHKKVYNLDYVTAIPEGKKCFAWFTNYKNQDVCFIMDLAFSNISNNNYNSNNYNSNSNNNSSYRITNIKIMNCCFSRELSYGTIFYGTQFYKGNTFFTIENVLYYKGKNVSGFQWGKKLSIMTEIMSNHIKQKSYNNSFIVFGLPLIKNSLEELLKDIENIKYKIEKIQFILFNKANVLLFVPYKNINYFLNSEPVVIKNDSLKKIANVIVPSCKPPPPPQLQIPQIQIPQIQLPQSHQINKNIIKNVQSHITKREIIFNVKPDIQNDIYHLYCDDISGEKYYDVAYIPDYNKSVLLNKLFRKIKENDNLDALEESDDEDEFEDDREDKFVYLDRSYKMYCIYNNKFKKWVPNKVADVNSKLINRKELNEIYINVKNKQ
jgi:hypothetical protein